MISLMALSHFLLLVFISLLGADDARIITLQNKCNTTIWPGFQIGAESNDPAKEDIDGGLELSPGKSVNLTAEYYATIWGRTGCSFNSSGYGTCVTGDCDGKLSCRDEIPGRSFIPPRPVTYALFNLGKNHIPDYYVVSVANGFNIPISILPYGDASGGGCEASSCFTELNQTCPYELQLRSNGRVVACMSPCFGFYTIKPRFCCSYYEPPDDLCKPTNYSEVFKAACPTALPTLTFDFSKVLRCSEANNYLISFC
ncbi:pathogenesis-related thaumatin-like protein 3.5 [Hevea brasiliensis]|uniref:pathogenesis-related thaumatin-like protein 3.5 n=1 Tax=Hevea brasiliensis TaxID=3981 RepID=UPI0025D2C39D|nr:pathogenesis-related thaumatin-like protein 3.5 [Hevea brasiliensis]